jgi:hypothetical protein
MEEARAVVNSGAAPASEVLVVAVGSSNPSKVKAVEDAFKSVFPESGIRAIPFGVESGVADQVSAPSACLYCMSMCATMHWNQV